MASEALVNDALIIKNAARRMLRRKSLSKKQTENLHRVVRVVNHYLRILRVVT
jgi:hypothetical protein